MSSAARRHAALPKRRARAAMPPRGSVGRALLTAAPEPARASRRVTFARLTFARASVRARFAFLFALLVAAAALQAQTPRSFTVSLHNSLSLQILGATAAYATDPSIADAAVANGTVTLFGRGVGRTQIIVVSITGQNAFELLVQPRAGAHTADAAAKSARGGIDGRAELRYASAGRELHNRIDVTRERGGTRTEAHVETAQFRRPEATTALPSASYRIFTPKRELTLLDRTVDHSPLTLTSTTVRGIHYLDEHWRLHAGKTAYTAYRTFLLPSDERTILGAGYTQCVSARSCITPSLFVYPGRGNVASLLYDYNRDETLSLRAELGASHGLGGALQFSMDHAQDQLRADVRYRAHDFATVSAGDTHGFFADAAWSHTFARGSSVDTAVSANDFHLPGFSQRTFSAISNGRLRVSDRLTLLGGASYGAFDDNRTLTVPAGAQLDFSRFGVTAIARWSQSSATNRGGLGFRIAARASAGRLFATGYLDRQQQAPTLALIFREEPELALALAELGITATSAADIARALRENSALVQLGYIEGVTVDLAPMRTQAGFELAWLGADAAHSQLRLRVLTNRTESVASRIDTTIATLTASRNLTASTSLFASYTYWLTQRRGQADVAQPIVEAGVRHQFDELPSLGARGTIRGTVYLDDDLDGVPEGAVADAELELDGARKVTTGANGTFAFERVGSGAHRVTARVPRAPEAYFTTASKVEANAGEELRFGVAFTPARVFGRLVDDAGAGIAQAQLALTRGATRVDAVTATDGTFSFAAAPGEWELALDAATLPPGFALVTPPQRLQLQRESPVTLSFAARANRSISGRVPAGVTSVTIEPGARVVAVGEGGRFLARSLPAGEITLRAGARTMRVTLPREPVAMKDVQFEDAIAIAPVQTAAVKLAAASAVERDFYIQLGAFRVRAYAEDLVRRARAAGVDAVMVAGARLTLVRSAALTHAGANAAMRQLARAGIEALIVPAH
ncbi:MAG TPA: SPOR domain-containing protein [Thermoanaerobaculia bacterium]